MLGETPDEELEVINRAWSVFTESESVFKQVSDFVIDEVTAACRQQINSGNYDASAPLADVYDAFEAEYNVPEADFVSEVLYSEKLILDTAQFGQDEMNKIIFNRLIQHLVDSGQLLYVYNRQQVRSHVAEMARYFALMRQRLGKKTEYRFTPNLVKMVKLASSDRQQPIVGKEKEAAVRFHRPIREINEIKKDDDIHPAWELRDAAGSKWQTIVSETMETMSQFFQSGLPDDFDSLAAYQARAFRDIYVNAVTDQEPSKSHVVTASTGGGKTEAFLFPTLAYSLTAGKSGIDGNKAVLTYPRRDLCNNQFERLFDYVTEINKIERGGNLDDSFEDAPLTIGLQHGAREDMKLDCPHEGCGGTLEVPDDYQENHFECTEFDSHQIKYAVASHREQADIIVTTQDSLHLRLMDKNGRKSFWESTYPPKFMVLDEVHIYTDQAGMNVANVVRRFKRAIEEQAPEQSPTLVASSATINNAESFTQRIFGTRTAKEITPTGSEKDTLSREHFVFVKATEPRDVKVPIGDSMYKPREEWDNIEPTTATNLSCMIQIAFAFQHTMRKESAADKDGLDVDKDRVLGFVDSIDSVSRLGSYIQDAEENGLFKLRQPDALLGDRDNNPDCPRDLFRGGTDDEYDEEAVCETLPPNPNVNPCPVYNDGECWWTMQDRELDLEKLKVALHRSGKRKLVREDRDAGDDWDQLIATSALEVGFDHSSIIGTFQYRAPRNVPGFVQRKGRGGRDAEDEPISVVVFGSTPTDSYYFHHSNYLSNPEEREDLLRISLDEDNRFIRRKHMTAAIIDYFNVNDDIDANRFYSQSKGKKSIEIEYLQHLVDNHQAELENWLATGFSVGEDEVNHVIKEFKSYLKALQKPVGPDGEAYIDIFSTSMKKYDGNDRTQALGYIDGLLDNLEAKR